MPAQNMSIRTRMKWDKGRPIAGVESNADLVVGPGDEFSGCLPGTDLVLYVEIERGARYSRTGADRRGIEASG